MFVPTNMAVNFVQHNRCTFTLLIYIVEISNNLFTTVNIEESGPPRKKRAEAAAKPAAASIPVELPKRPENVGGKKEHDKASDDFYFEKFRRQFRR